jgi:hypothetical protein
MTEPFAHTPVRGKDWSLTAQSFQHLLEWLGAGTAEGQAYLEMRRRLVAYFDRKNCRDPNDLADEVLNRVARRLEEPVPVDIEPPAKYCFIVARFVFMEHLRESKKADALRDDIARLEAGTQRDKTEHDESQRRREKQLDCLEFYLLNYFKAGTGEETPAGKHGRKVFEQVGCASCHLPTLRIERDRRVADVETTFDPVNGHFNRLFATARVLLANPSSIGQPLVAKVPALQPFVVDNIYADFKRHDLGPAFHERNYDGALRTEFLTTPLWGVGSTAPYGHDGRSINLTEVILRHGGEAQASRDAFAGLPEKNRDAIIAFLNALIIFPPDDTASNLDPGNRAAALFPQYHHGSIRLTGLFNNPAIVE